MLPTQHYPKGQASPRSQTGVASAMSAGGARCAMQTHRSRSCSHSPWPGDQFAPVRALVSRILSSRTAPPSPTRRVHRQPRLTDGDCLRSGAIPYGRHASPSLLGRTDGRGAFRCAGCTDTARTIRYRSVAAGGRRRAALPRQERGGRPRAGVAGRADTTLRIAVSAGVAGIRDKPINRPSLYPVSRSLRHDHPLCSNRARKNFTPGRFAAKVD